MPNTLVGTRDPPRTHPASSGELSSSQMCAMFSFLFSPFQFEFTVMGPKICRSAMRVKLEVNFFFNADDKESFFKGSFVGD